MVCRPTIPSQPRRRPASLYDIATITPPSTPTATGRTTANFPY